MGQGLKQASCDPECGFMVRSHDENEVVDVIKMHAKEKHKMSVTDDEAKAKVMDA